MGLYPHGGNLILLKDRFKTKGHDHLKKMSEAILTKRQVQIKKNTAGDSVKS